MTNDILTEYRDLKRIEDEMRHKDWLDNYQNEKERIKSIKEEIMFKEQSK
jgi:hypothetical protein